jgi:uncharacterized protein YidB (DUF937 family)
MSRGFPSMTALLGLLAIAGYQLEQAIGPDILDTLSRQTGLPQDELLARLSRELPKAVDQYTPHGRLPTEADFSPN